jgi:hypothetical protein
VVVVGEERLPAHVPDQRAATAAPDHVNRDAPIVTDTVAPYRGGKGFLVKSVDDTADPPVAVLREVRS